jgi:Ca2+/H+ antiporter
MEFPTLENIDIVLAGKVEKLAKAYNWLTGKDNFSLARLLNKARFFVCVIFCISVEIFQNANEVGQLKIFFSAAIIILYAMFTFLDVGWGEKMISRAEKIREIERRLGARYLSQMEESKMKRYKRYVFILMCIVVSYIVHLLLLNALALSDLFDVIILHLIDLDEPPYKKSRLIEKIREAVTIPKLSPVPTH